MTNDVDRLISWIHLEKPNRIAVLTGAGISAESGIPTFRGAGGLWESYRPEELATPEAFDRDPELVWRWYEWRRDLVRQAEPNPAHLALAELERKIHPRGTLTLITQNVDGLHRKAGSENVLELHGSIFRARCVRHRVPVSFIGPAATIPPRCSCGALLRPDIVWFGETLPEGILEAATLAVAQADLFLVIGTSGTVYPAAGLVSLMRRGRVVEINLEETPLSSYCDFSIQARAGETVPLIATAIEETLL